MKRTLRLLAWLLSLTMLCELLPFAAFAQSDVGKSLASASSTFLDDTNGTAIATGFCGDNIVWSLSDDGTLTIRGSGDMPYIGSRNYWLKYSSKIQRAVVKPGITSIGDYAFYYCRTLKEIELPDTITKIGTNSFQDCSGLERIIFPESLISIGSNAFIRCSGLKSIVIPPNTTTIIQEAFSYCYNLENVFLPLSIETIDNWAFDGCRSLKDVYYEGFEPQWNSINFRQNSKNSPIFTATRHYNSYSFTPSEPSEDKKTFTFGQDNLSFSNSMFDFFNGGEITLKAIRYLLKTLENKPGSYHYQLSQSKLDQLEARFSPRVKQRLELVQKSFWGGSCEGMARVVMLNYIAPNRILLNQIDSSASSLYDLNAPKKDSNVEDLINYYFLQQCFPSAYNLYADCFTRFQDDIDNEINTIITELRNKRPILVGIHTAPNSETGSASAHAIVLLDLIDESDDSCTIRVYDPNYTSERNLTLYKNSYYTASDGHYPKIQYGSYRYIHEYTASSDLEFIDLRNFFGCDDNENKTDYDDNHVIFSSTGSYQVQYGRVFFRSENGKLIENSTDVRTYPISDGDDADSVELVFPRSSKAELQMNISSTDIGNADILLDDTLFSISTSGPAKLTYDEQARTASITADDPTVVNILMTQNETSESFPWHSWAIDTTDTTTLQIKLDDTGLHLTGDGLANAEYAIKNEDTDKLVSGTITESPDSVTGLISTTINPSNSNNDPTPTPTPSKPTSPTTSSSSGGGGGGAALILGAGAVALTAGLVMTAPVAVQGKAEFADHTAVPGAKIALLQNGNVIAQTTADESGSFSFKVKRGNYELTAAYTDIDGQLHHQTLPIKAPAKDLTITF